MHVSEFHRSLNGLREEARNFSSHHPFHVCDASEQGKSEKKRPPNGGEENGERDLASFLKSWSHADGNTP